MKHRILTYLLILAAQIVLTANLGISYYLTLSVLPVLVLCIPMRYGRASVMFAAFAMGLAVDILAEGVVGLNVMALVCIAFLRDFLCRILFSEETVNRKENFSVGKHGAVRVFAAVLLVQALFLAVYIWADGGQAWPFAQSAIRFAVSLFAGVAVSYPLANILTEEEDYD